jgi:hypothetical protein
MAATTGVLIGATAQAEDWTAEAITPVTNPIFFESPLIQSEVRPVFAWHRLDGAFLGTDVDVRVYALQLRYAVTDRLAILATKDGYIEFNPETGGAQDGWADIGLGLKYAVYKNEEQQCVVTPGLTFEIPSGNQSVFQGNGSGEFNLFVSAVKGWDKFHLTGNLGGRIPVNMDKETANIRYSLMADYYTCRWFIPFTTINAVTTLTEGNQLPVNSEGFDLINFGSTSAGGRTQAALGVGFRSRLLSNVDLGFAYERGFAPNNDIFKDRFTVDVVCRF